MTKRQSSVLSFLHSFAIEKGYPPTIREIGLAFGIRSPNGVMCHLNFLESRGFIQREPDVSRGIRLMTLEPEYSI